ncbi:hypothetical protein [Paenibacillus sp. HJGM_3]
MKYTNATDILPKELVEKLQQFVQGEYLYIPASRDESTVVPLKKILK